MIWNGVNVGDILTAILATVLPLIFLALARDAKNAYVAGKADAAKLVWAKLTNEQQATILNVVHMGVTMAEQIIQRQDVRDYGAAKKEAAFEFVDTHLAELGITLSANTIYGMIESAVLQVFNPEKMGHAAAAEAPAATA